MGFLKELAKDLDDLGYHRYILNFIPNKDNSRLIINFNEAEIPDCLPFFQAFIQTGGNAIDYDAFDEIEGITSYDKAKVTYGINEAKIDYEFTGGKEIPKCLPAKYAIVLPKSGTTSIMSIDIQNKTYELTETGHSMNPDLPEVMKRHGLSYSKK